MRKTMETWSTLLSITSMSVKLQSPMWPLGTRRQLCCIKSPMEVYHSWKPSILIPSMLSSMLSRPRHSTFNFISPSKEFSSTIQRTHSRKTSYLQCQKLRLSMSNESMSFQRSTPLKIWWCSQRLIKRKNKRFFSFWPKTIVKSARKTTTSILMTSLSWCKTIMNSTWRLTRSSNRTSTITTTFSSRSSRS